jgi:hypothetical protein
MLKGMFSKHKHKKNRGNQSNGSNRHGGSNRSKATTSHEVDYFPELEEPEDPEDVDMEFIGDIKISTILDEEEKTKDEPTVKKAPRTQSTTVHDYSGYEGFDGYGGCFE